MTNRSILVAVAIAMLASGVSASPSFARGSNGGTGAAAAAGAPGAGGHGVSPATLSAVPVISIERVPPIQRTFVKVDPKFRCGGEGDLDSFDMKCKPASDFVW